ncbi:helix-turn-helix domain-containing protein [Cryptosporangium arvum]|uniref:helix-turn-helix domain-containing protein n=1 Tax=Cryptosporangium arvum TaxID=80871 RepID=UPI0004AFE7BE|nr:AraC family transcriptional regulator [Cryptosporangium arvum]
MTLPSRLLRSRDWNTVSAALYLDPPVAEPFRTAATDDLLVVTVLSGHYTIASASGRTTYHPGSVGLTAPGNTSELRWTALRPDPMESVHIRLRPALFAGATGLPDALVTNDPLVSALGTSLGDAVRRDAPTLYADTMAQALAVQLASHPRRDPGPLGRRQVDRVVGYMHAHLSDDVTLDALAAQANVSKYHFVRLFTRATGRTPHRYLRDLRLRRGAELLAGPESVQRIALACGYRSPGQFATAFRREYGVSPTDYRRGESRSESPTRS